MVKLPGEVKYDKKGTRQHFKSYFKKDAVALVSEDGCSIFKAAKAVGATTNNLRRGKKDLKQEESDVRLSADERTELDWLRRRVKQLRMENEILKRPAHSLRKKLNKIRLD
ncbi:transposase [Microbulbifer sp. SSSA008]|uniref:transposase n=1 Tax=Microbulbifer sp. SSSA008 TaxID=3243380 RepID=UPI004039DC4F